MKTFAAAMLALVLAAGTIACQSEPKSGGDYSFTDEGGQTVTSLAFFAVPFGPQVVTVAGGEKWEVASQPEWIEAERVEGTLVVTAEVNESFRERKGEIAVKAGSKTIAIAVTQQGNIPSYEIVETAGIPASTVSHNGRYVIGTYQGRSFVYDRQNAKLTVAGVGKGVADPQDITQGTVHFYGIGDNGLAAGCAAVSAATAEEPNAISLRPCTYNVQTKAFTWLPITGTGIDAGASSGNAWSVSADGSAISGYLQLPRTGDGDEIELAYLPVVWKNNVPNVLGHPLEGLDEGDNTRGYMPTDISADGSVVAGYLATRFSDYVGCYWKMSEPGTVNFFLRDDPDFYSTYVNETTGKTLPDKFPRTSALSSDGKVITGTVVDASNASSIAYTPFSYDIENGEVDAAWGNNALGAFTMPSGALVYTLSQTAGAWESYFYENGQSTFMYDWLLDNYSIEEVPAGRATFRDVSLNGRTIVGSCYEGGGYQTIIVSL